MSFHRGINGIEDQTKNIRQLIISPGLHLLPDLEGGTNRPPLFCEYQDISLTSIRYVTLKVTCEHGTFGMEIQPNQRGIMLNTLMYNL